ncbi:dTDP-4-dehydrorhamnose reductase [Bacteroidales bacterium WCE2004]|nr:dTDP-4-dehydrorhamnose reductase [Bacteroidales bacterium WCE2004]
MNILVTGANGQLGNSLRLAACQSPFRFVFTDIADASEESVAMLRRLGGAGVDTSTRRLDITDLEAVRALVREERIGAVVNCAAFTNVDAAETQPELAERLNAQAPENLAVAMKEAGGLLVHISTDYVFGKEPYNRPCREDQAGTPTGVYGLTKLHGEQAIRSVGCDHVILRTAWLYSEFGKNFVRTMLHLTATKPQLKVVFDQTGTPTYAGDLAAAILAILGDYSSWHSSSASPTAAPYPRSGTYHYSNEGVCSWFDFTKTIAALADELTVQTSPSTTSLPGNAPQPGSCITAQLGSSITPQPGLERVSRSACDIQPCHSEEYPSPVKRPAYSVLDKTKIKATFGLSIPYWTDSLRRCLTALL